MNPTNERQVTLPAVSALVPAYNEGGRIGNVLAALRQVSSLAEIIVVDDGSLDSTWEEACQAAESDPRLRLCRHAHNLGKGQAIFTGWQAARNNCLLTLDADLYHLEPHHVEALLQPVVSRQAEMSLGVFRRGDWKTDLSHRVTPWLTGQRCFWASLLEYVPEEAAAGYGIETAITVIAQRLGWSSQTVLLYGVSHPPSESHRGFKEGLNNRARMYAQIARALYRALRYPLVSRRGRKFAGLE